MTFQNNEQTVAASTTQHKIAIPVNGPDKIQLLRPSHVFFAHADLDEFVRFAADFGLKEVGRANGKIYYGGYGKDPYVYVASQSSDAQKKPQFGGPAFVAASQEDFDKAARLDGAEVHDLQDAPGGGKLVTITRPNGTWFHIVYGQRGKAEHTPGEKPPSAVVVDQNEHNYPFYKPRQGKSQDRLTFRAQLTST